MAKIPAGELTETSGLTDVDTATNVIIKADNSVKVALAINRALAAGLEEVGLAAEGFAKGNLTRNHSVDTGRLRNSVTHVIDMGESAVYVGTNVEYGPYVELGTSRSAAKPYLEPAASGHGGFYRDILKKHLENG